MKDASPALSSCRPGTHSNCARRLFRCHFPATVRQRRKRRKFQHPRFRTPSKSNVWATKPAAPIGANPLAATKPPFREPPPFLCLPAESRITRFPPPSFPLGRQAAGDFLGLVVVDFRRTHRHVPGLQRRGFPVVGQRRGRHRLVA